MESIPFALPSLRVLYVLLPVRPVFGDEKKLSIAAFFHALPDWIIEKSTQLSAIGCWNRSLVIGCDDLSNAAARRTYSDAKSPSTGHPRRFVRSNVIAAPINHPTWSREKVNDGGHIEVALGCQNLGEVGAVRPA